MLSWSPRNEAPGSTAMYGISRRRSISAATSLPHSGAAGRPASAGTSRTAGRTRSEPLATCPTLAPLTHGEGGNVQAHGPAVARGGPAHHGSRGRGGVRDSGGRALPDTGRCRDAQRVDGPTDRGAHADPPHPETPR